MSLLLLWQSSEQGGGQQELAASVSGAASTEVALNVLRSLIGSLQGTASSSGTLIEAPVELVSSISGAGTTVGSIEVLHVLSRSLQGIATVSGAVLATFILEAAPSGSATSVGSLTVTSPLFEAHELQGDLEGISFVESILSLTVAFEGSGQGVASSLGRLNFILPSFNSPQSSYLGSWKLPVTDYMGTLTELAGRSLRGVSGTGETYTWYLTSEGRSYAIEVLFTQAGLSTYRLKVVAVAGPASDVGDALKVELLGKTFTYRGLPTEVILETFIREEVQTLVEVDSGVVLPYSSAYLLL